MISFRKADLLDMVKTQTTPIPVRFEFKHLGRSILYCGGMVLGDMDTSNYPDTVWMMMKKMESVITSMFDIGAETGGFTEIKNSTPKKVMDGCVAGVKVEDYYVGYKIVEEYEPDKWYLIIEVEP